MHNKETLGFFINFTLLHSPSDKPVSNPEGVNCTLLPPGTVIHLHALTFACLQRQAFLCFPMQFHTFNLKQMIAGKKKKKHYHLGEASGVYRKKERVYGQIHLPLLQSISHLKKYTITRQERAKIYGLETSPLTSIHQAFLAPSLPEWLFLTVTMIYCLSLLFYKYISFI